MSGRVATTVPVWIDLTLERRGATPVSPALEEEAVPLSHRGGFPKESRHVITTCVMEEEGGGGGGWGGTTHRMPG